MFAYCLNNPVNGKDSEGTLFFTALGAVAGFIGSAAISLISGNDLNTAIDDGIAGAVGGAIAGAGVDAALLIVGSGGAAAPAVAFAVAYTAGGIGNVVTTSMTAEDPMEPEDYVGSFIIGGTFNSLSLATSWACAGKTAGEIAFKGAMCIEESMAVGTLISSATGIATGVSTTKAVTSGR